MFVIFFLTDTSTGLMYYLMAFPILVHPLIIFRLLKHRVVMCLRTENGENRSRSSSAGNEESLRLRRQTDSSPSTSVKGLAFLPVLETPSLNSSTDNSKSPSPSSKKKRSFRFASLRRKKRKTSDENSLASNQAEASEADIVAFQRELQNLPPYPTWVSHLSYNIYDHALNLR